MLDLGYPVSGLNETDFSKNEYIRIGGKTILDLHSSYFGIKYEDIDINWFEYDNVHIAVATKESLIKLMSKTGVHSEDIRVMRLLDDPLKNAEELHISQ